MMRELLAIGLGGALGSILRYLLNSLVVRTLGSRFPWGILLVNVIGCFAIGVLVAMMVERRSLRPEWHGFLVVGLLGGLTTFSTFGHDTVLLLRAGSLRLALANILGNVLCGLSAVWLGQECVRRWGA